VTSFYETVEQARALLERNGRVSLAGLKREFELDDEALDELVEELVDVQQVAAREGKVLSWIGAGPAATEPHPSQSREVAPETAAAQAAREAERRQLTVMFCDLVDSTDLSQRLDAEDLRNVVRAYQESASSVIERYAGHIAQYLGDGLLVYFGYPQAHEEDAERAVRAGLAVVDSLAELNPSVEEKHGLRLSVRVGIHTGPVVVGEMGGGDKRETLALGDTTNVAARLQEIASPNAVVVSPETLRLVRGIFVTEDLGPHPLKGVPERVELHRVVQAGGVRSRLDLAAKLTPLVGRQEELGLLLGRWERVQDGEGQAVLVLGEAGVGKSRLARALRERLLAEAHTWLECRGSPFAVNSPLHPVIELVQQGLTFTEGESPESKLRKLEAGLEGVGLALAETVPLLTALLGIPLPEHYAPLELSPELGRQRTLEALVAWALALAGSRRCSSSRTCTGSIPPRSSSSRC
jgi:class 3 adenylate cyclase